jgi:Na+-transporting NADH:ubiquinone oxidoreductase subunit C
VSSPSDQATDAADRGVSVPSNDRPAKILLVAVVLCLVCSILVSAAAVALKPIQDRNALLRRQQQILEVAGVYEPGAPIPQQFERVDVRMVDLSTGEYVEDQNPLGFDIRRASRDPDRSIAVTTDADIAKIHRRPTEMPVYLIERDGELETVVLPVHGYGLWSTLYAYIALESDARTVRGITFYSHAETPGLGGEIDNPRWLAQWPGKVATDPAGKVLLQVAKAAAPGDQESHIDAIAGATLTSRGVQQLVRYWLGEQGFGPYLARLRERRGETT